MKDLLVEQLRDMYDAENRIVDALPKMCAKASDPDLKDALESHLEETKEHVNRVAEACRILGVSPQGKTCEATKGLIKECEETLAELSDPVVGDAAIIAAAQRVEHYEIASYGSAATFAKCIDAREVHDLLGETLAEEKAADDKLTKIATGGAFSSGINKEAIHH